MTPSNYEFKQIGATVSSWKRPILVSHARPDGDALGCLVAMRAIMRSLGATPRVVIFEPAPERYRFLLEQDPLDVLNRDLTPADLDSADGVGIEIEFSFTHAPEGLKTCPVALRTKTLVVAHPVK